jgi:hypothetical protein
MNRRTLLQATTTVPLALVAGCTSSSDTDDADGNGENDAESQGDVGLTIETGGVELTLANVELALELETDDGERHESNEGEMWVLANVAVANRSEETQDLPRAENFKLVTGGEQYDSAVPSSLAAPVSGEGYDAPTDARQDVSAGGWLAFSIPDATESATLSWAGAGDSEADEDEVARDEASWDLSLDPAELPDVGFLELNLPETVAIGDEIAAEVVLENAGGTEYTVETALEAERPGGSTDTKSFEVTVPAEDTASAQHSFTPLMTGSFTVTLGEYSVSKSVEVTPLTAAFGETVAVDGLPQITISDPIVTDSFEADSYYGTETVQADGSFVFFEFEVQNTSRNRLSAPRSSDLDLSANGSVYDTASLDVGISASYVDPIEGGEYGTYGTIGAGETVAGVLRFDVPSSTAPADLELLGEWSNGYASAETSIHWSQ